MCDAQELADILIVDDRPDNLTVLEAVLDLPGIRILKAESGEEAVARASENELAVVLLDVQMPGIDGFETAKRLRNLERAKNVPILFVTAIYSDDNYIQQGYAAGAVDYIFKPYNPYILQSKVSVFVEMYRMNKRLLKQEEMLRESEARERARQMALIELRSLQREREVQQKYRDLVESIDHCIVWSADPVTLRFTFISHRAQELTGHPMREWTEDPGFLQKHIFSDDRRRVLEALDNVEVGQEISIQHRMVGKNDRVLWFHTSVRLAKKSRGLGYELRGLSLDITGAKMSQEQLREAQERLSKVVQTSPVVILAAQKDGTVVLAEGKGLEAAGLKAEGLVGRSIYEIGEKNDESFKGFSAALEGRESRAEIRLRKCCFEAYFSPQKNEKGEITGVVAVAHDVTDWKRSEEERQKLISLVANTSDFVFVASPDRRITYINTSGQKMLGLANREDWHSRRFLDFFSAEDRTRVEKEILPLLLEQGTWTGELNYSHVQTGKLIPTTLNLLTIRDPHSHDVIALASIGRDITERKTAEDKQRFLAEAGACLAHSLDYDSTLPEIAALIVPRLADLCFVRILQEDGSLKLATFRCENDDDARRVFDMDQLRPPLLNDSHGSGKVIRTGKSEICNDLTDEQIDLLNPNPEKARYLKNQGMKSFLCVPMLARGRAVGVICLWNRERRLEDSQVALFEELGHRVAAAIENAKLYQNAEMAIHTRDEFLSIASHELKTPLTPLKLQFQTISRLARDGKLSTLPQEKIEKMFDRSDRQISRITNLIEDLLNVSRINLGQISLELRPIDLGKLITDVSEQFRDQLTEAKCDLTLKLEPGLTGRWDPFRLEQVFINLLTNAIKYGPGAPIEIVSRQERHSAVVSFVDHGIGIESADQKRIFELFERAVPSRHYGGLGLGLYIVRNIVEAHGGSVTVFSEPGKGSSFSVHLPLMSVFPLKFTLKGRPREDAHGPSQLVLR